MANSSGLKDRPSRTSLRGVATLYQGSITSAPQEEPNRQGATRLVGSQLQPQVTRRPEPFDESSSTDCRLAPCRTRRSALAGQPSDGKPGLAPCAHRVLP